MLALPFRFPSEICASKCPLHDIKWAKLLSQIKAAMRVCVCVSADCSQGKKAMSKLRFFLHAGASGPCKWQAGRKVAQRRTKKKDGKRSKSQNSSSNSFMLDLKFRLGFFWLHSSANRVWRNVYVWASAFIPLLDINSNNQKNTVHFLFVSFFSFFTLQCLHHLVAPTGKTENYYSFSVWFFTF